MEQKLAEFRARRQAEHAVKKDEGAGPQCTAQTVAAPAETTSTSDSEQTEEEAENSRDSPQSSTRKVRNNSVYEQLLWLLEFCLNHESGHKFTDFMMECFLSYWLGQKKTCLILFIYGSTHELQQIRLQNPEVLYLH